MSQQTNRKIPADLIRAQIDASDPAVSAFVSANAGAGKTYVLVQRVIRLMLAGVAPGKILCITFTKAAATNMSLKLFDTLGKWIALGDDELDQEIAKAGAKPTPRLRKRARQLFASALETPGGLKVQTIHALCTRLLQQFPFEANVAAGFAVLDERDQAGLMERAHTATLVAAANEPASALGRALKAATIAASDMTFSEVIAAACAARTTFIAWLEHETSAASAIATLSRALGVAPEATLADIEQDILASPYLPSSEWQSVAATLATGSKTDTARGEELLKALAARGEERCEIYFNIFLTAERSLRKTLVTQAIAKSHPDLAARFADEGMRVLTLYNHSCAIRARDKTAALLTLADAVYRHYRAEKESRGLLDYDDLIAHTLALLTRTPPTWVHYRLDSGIDHVLVDEAQDTSPSQWDIITRLVSEFAGGAGARDGVKRTIFAVGDEKQSIYSFQGASPREFGERRRVLQKEFEAAGLTWRNVPFNYSFRSGASVLTAVEGVFQPPDILRSVTIDADIMPPHNALEGAPPGIIDLWDLEAPDDRDENIGWRAPFDAQLETSAPVKLARRIANEIASMMSGAAGQPRINAGDILILVRKRGPFFDAVIQALKRAELPVAGSDRLTLTDHIAVTDLMALADALLLPRDDLALAVALKSPLFGLTEDDLFTLAWNREGSLRDALHARSGDARFAEADQRLARYESKAAQLSPFAFFAWLLGGDQGRAKMLARLGLEANDAIDEFLELALTHEQRGCATLQTFMAWLRATETEIKRDMNLARDEIRVMTAHGAKGLEAKVVILADTTSQPAASNKLKFVTLSNYPRPAGAPPPMAWVGAKGGDSEALASARQKALDAEEDEHRRLLYVAMTRAAEHLIIAGALGRGAHGTLKPGTWYDLAAKGLAGSTDLESSQIIAGGGNATRYRRRGTTDAAHHDTVPANASAPLAEPAWLRGKALRETPATCLLRPSDVFDETHAANSAANPAIRQMALMRGTLTHRLLQSLPNIPADARPTAALQFLEKHARDWPASEREALAGKVIAIMSDEKLAALFGPGSRAEVSIAGQLERGSPPSAIVSGQIDRLVVAPDGILIADFKTNRAPPAPGESAPDQYVAQLALYRAVLSQLYPDRPVRAALIWTETAEFMEVSAPQLDAALTQVMSA